MYARNIAFAPGVSSFLFGPRGTGKTTWLKAALPDAVFVDLLEARTFNRLAADPQRLGEIAPRQSGRPIVIDEIQKLPELLDEVHRLIESKGHWFILTGSSARKLRRAGVNLLGGRALTRYCHPLTAAELGTAYDFGKCLANGLLPTVHDPEKKVQPEAYLSSYVQTYLREEVMLEGLSRNLGAFARLLETASFSQAQLLNVSAVARECQVKRKMAEAYFGVLEDLLLAVRLPVFEKRAQRRLTHHPKFFLFDTGVFRSLRPTGPLDSAAELDGPALETLVLQELRATLAWCDPDANIAYWRTASGLEVDFVIYSTSRFLAVEVKRSRSVSVHDLRGLRAFRDDYPEATCLVLYGGDHELHIDGIPVAPIRDALPRLESLLSSAHG